MDLIRINFARLDDLFDLGDDAFGRGTHIGIEIP